MLNWLLIWIHWLKLCRKIEDGEIGIENSPNDRSQVLQHNLSL